jgi:pimeloyl-ACP methyl ester carboxylesterase
LSENHGPASSSLVAGRLALRDAGSGPAVVLLHGLAGFKELWAETESALVAEGYRVVAYDQRGHGQSHDVVGPWAIADLSRDLGLVLDRLGIDRACVVGHSMGGRAMFDFALDRADRTAAVVAVGAQSEAPKAAYRTILQNLRAQTASHGLAGFRREFERAKEIPERVGRDSVFARSFEARFAANRTEMLMAGLDAILAMPTLTARLGEIRVPMLAVVGERDTHFLEIARQYSKVVPDCRTMVIPDCHHYPMVDGAAAFNRGLVAFLSEAWAV